MTGSPSKSSSTPNNNLYTSPETPLSDEMCPTTADNSRKRSYSEYNKDSSMLARRRYPAFNGKCYRHSTQVYLAECSNTQRALQAQLSALSSSEQAKISNIWREFAAQPSETRLLILQGIVNICCIPQLSYLNKVVPKQLRVDFMAAAPADVSLKILSYLDAHSLCQAAQVSRTWAVLANDDILWHRMCAQHIDKVCRKCGWGLPLLDKSSRRVYEATTRRALQLSTTANSTAGGENKANSDYTFALPTSNVNLSTMNATANAEDEQQQQRQMIPISSLLNSANIDGSLISSVCIPQLMQQKQPQEQQQLPVLPAQILEQFQKNLISAQKSRESESDEMSDTNNNNPCQSSKGGNSNKRRPWKEIFAERQIIANNWRKFRYKESHIQAHRDGILCVQFNDEYLITGSYDSNVRVWCAETFQQISELSGHTMPVRALEFDECKLFSGSLDGTVKIWNYRDGTCIRTLRVFENGGVISLCHHKGTLVVGGENGAIRVYNIAKMTSFTLTGHTDWVNSVQLYGENRLLSCSDDTLIKEWDLEERRCVRTCVGHTHHVQSLQLSSRGEPAASASNSRRNKRIEDASSKNDHRPYMVSGSLDSTMRVWDIETGRCLDTIFGHTESIWSMAFDALRIVSGSNDGTLKVWDTATHKCLYTLKASTAAINSVAISDTKIVVGDNEGSVYMYDFRDL